MTDSTPPPPDAPVRSTGKAPAVHLATNAEVKKWGMWPSVFVGAFALLGNGGVIAFALGYAERVEAKATAAAIAGAQAVVTVQTQRGDVLAAEQRALKERLEAVDAGVKVELQQVKGEVAQLRSSIDRMRDDNVSMQKQILNELRKK